MNAVNSGASVQAPQTSQETSQTSRGADLAQWISAHRSGAVLVTLFLAALVVFTIWAPGFLSLDNITNVGRQSVYLLVVSLAQLIVLIVGGLDLSVGMVVALASVVGATVMAQMLIAMPDSPILAILAGSVAGMAAGGLVPGKVICAVKACASTGAANRRGISELRFNFV